MAGRRLPVQVLPRLRGCWVGLAAAILERYGLPPELGSYVTGFYKALRHWFESDGAVASEPVCPRVGALQGCPLSCLLMAGIMSVWVMAMRAVPDTKTHVFADDRIVSTSSEKPEERLVEAAETSGKVDKALGLERHPDKRAAATPPRRGARG